MRLVTHSHNCSIDKDGLFTKTQVRVSLSTQINVCGAVAPSSAHPAEPPLTSSPNTSQSLHPSLREYGQSSVDAAGTSELF